MRPSVIPLTHTRLWRLFLKFTWGGEWALPLATIVTRNLTWFFSDGLFASASDNIIITYVTLYILALGATNAQVGLMSSFSSLASAASILSAADLPLGRGGGRQLGGLSPSP